MSAKNLVRWIIIVITVMTAFTLWTVPVRAEPTPPHEPACLNCHEDLYYLHDTGKWYCVSEARDRCAYCHGGNPTTTEKEAAHEGRTAHPVINNDVTKCRQCHPQDYNAHVVKFNQVAGISPVVYVAQPYTPSIAPERVVQEQKGLNQAEIFIWSVAGAMIFIIMMGGALVFSVWSKRR